MERSVRRTVQSVRFDRYVRSAQEAQMPSIAPNPYLEGNFAPVRAELTETVIAVDGTIPEYLDGRYLRNGPNPVADPDPTTYHWFLGTGMVHGLRIRDGR